MFSLQTEPLRLFYVVYDKANSAVSLPSFPTDVPLTSRPSSPTDPPPSERKRSHTEDEETPDVALQTPAKRHRSDMITSASATASVTSQHTSDVLPTHVTPSTSLTLTSQSSSTSLATLTLSEDKDDSMSVSSDDADDDEPLSVLKSRIQSSENANKTIKDDASGAASCDSKRTDSAKTCGADNGARAAVAVSGTSGCAASVTCARATVSATAVTSAAQIAAAINNRNSTAPVYSSVPECCQASATEQNSRSIASKLASLAPKTVASLIQANEMKAQTQATGLVSVTCARGSTSQQRPPASLNHDPDTTTTVTAVCPQRPPTSLTLPAKLCHTKTTKRATTNGTAVKRDQPVAEKPVAALLLSSNGKMAAGKHQLVATAKTGTKPHLAALKPAAGKLAGGIVKQTAIGLGKTAATSPTEPGKAPVHRSPPNFEALVRNIGKKSPTQTSPPVSHPSTSPSLAHAQLTNGKLPNYAGSAPKRGSSKTQPRPGAGTPQPGLVKVTLGGAPSPAVTSAMPTLPMSHAMPISYPAFPSNGIFVINAGPTSQQIQQLLMQQQQLQQQHQQQQKQQQQKKKPPLLAVSSRAGNGAGRRRPEPAIAPATPVACCSVPMSPIVTSPITASPAVTSPVTSPVVTSPIATSAGATSPAVTSPVVRVPVTSNVVTNGTSDSRSAIPASAANGNKHVTTTTANTSHTQATTNACAATPASHAKANGNTHVTSTVNSSHVHVDSDVTEEEEEAPSNPLANGYDAPLELTTKKSRSREKERERERQKIVHKQPANSDKTLLKVPSLIRT